MSKFASSVCLCIFLLAVSALAQSPVQTSVDKTMVKTGELFKFTVMARGSFSAAEIEMPDLKPFRVISRTQSQQYRVRGGKKEFKTLITYVLMSPEPGTFTLGKAKVREGENEYTSEEITIEISGEKIEQEKKTPDVLEGAVTL